MASRLDYPTPSLRDALRSGSIFGGGVQDDLRSGMQSTFSNLRNGPTLSPGFAAQNQAANHPNAFAPGPAPAAVGSPAPVAPLAAPVPVTGGNPFTPPGSSPVAVAAAGGLVQAGQQGQMAAYQDALKQAEIDLSPDQAPGDFTVNHKAAVGIYNRFFGGPGNTSAAPSSSSGLPSGVPVSTYAPTDLRQQALAAGGDPFTPFGGPTVTAQAAPSGVGLPVWQQNQLPGNRFTLTQNPATVPAPGAAAPITAPVSSPGSVSPSAAPTPFQTNAAAYQATQAGGTIAAPDGSLFVRDAHGRLQQAGTNPDLAATAAGKKAGAEQEAKKAVDDAHTELSDLNKVSERARVRSAQSARIKDLYAKGATSGFGQDVLTGIGSAMARVTGKETSIANQQELEKHLGKFVLDNASDLSGQGQISDSERRAIQEAAANKNLTPQANLAILDVFGQVDARNLALEKERIRLDDLNVPAVQINKEIRRMRSEIPLDFSKLGGTAAAAKPQTIGKYQVTVH